MIEHDRASAYETVGCARDVLERLKYRDLPLDLNHSIARAKRLLSDIQAELHRLTGPLKDGGRVIGG